METDIKENKMGYWPENKLLLAMSAPLCVSMLIQALYNIVDSVFVANISEDAMTALSLAFPIQNTVIAVSIGTGIGVNALLSKSLGEKDFNKVNLTAHIGIILSALSYLIFLFFGLFFVESFFLSQTSDINIVKYGTEYLSIVLIFSLGLFGNIIMARLLQATGKTIYNMLSQGCGAIINIILDPILIFGLLGFPELGVKGAAIATIISQFAGFFVAVYFNLSKNKEITFSKKYFKLQKDIVKRIYIVGIPSMLVQSLGSFMVFQMNNLLLSFTSTATAAYGIFFKLQSFVFMPIFGMTNAMIPIVSYNYGAKKKDRIVKTVRLSMIYATIMMLIGLLIFQLFPVQLLNLFNASDDLIKIGVPMLRTISITFVFAGFGIVCGSTFQAFGKGIYTLVISLERQLLVIIPVAYFMAQTGNIDLVWWSMPIADTIAIFICLFFVKNVNKNILSKL